MRGWLHSLPEFCPLCAQFLESYKSVTLASMARAFGVSLGFIDRELVDFIVAGRLPAKIDKVLWSDKNSDHCISRAALPHTLLWRQVGSLIYSAARAAQV